MNADDDGVVDMPPRLGDRMSIAVDDLREAARNSPAYAGMDDEQFEEQFAIALRRFNAMCQRIEYPARRCGGYGDGAYRRTGPVLKPQPGVIFEDGENR